MKTSVAACACIVVCLSSLVRCDVSHLPQAQARSPEADAQATVYESEIDPQGNFHYKLETSNGITAEERGEVQDVGAEVPAIHVEGKAHWTAPGGEPVDFSYESGVNGYMAYGPLIPTSPPIPIAIQKALEYIANNPKHPDVTD